jgi:hypothetical protein
MHSNKSEWDASFRHPSHQQPHLLCRRMQRYYSLFDQALLNLMPAIFLPFVHCIRNANRFNPVSIFTVVVFVRCDIVVVAEMRYCSFAWDQKSRSLTRNSDLSLTVPSSSTTHNKFNHKQPLSRRTVTNVCQRLTVLSSNMAPLPVYSCE